MGKKTKNQRLKRAVEDAGVAPPLPKIDLRAKQKHDRGVYAARRDIEIANGHYFGGGRLAKSVKQRRR